MKIVLMGYGKMGREIERIALERGHEIVLRVNRDNAAQVTEKDLQMGEVIIEFSTPHAVMDNMNRCLVSGVPTVVGTTGWHNELKAVTALWNNAGGGLFYASNFSVGVNLFFKVNKFLAKLMNHYPQYEVSMTEIHHIHKLDKPSGTAITLANQVIEQMDRKTKWSIEDKSDDTLFIHDIREGEVPGTHILQYSSTVDDIEIMHKAHNRSGFALGAVLAAEFMLGKKGVYTMDDLIGEFSLD